MILLVLLVAYFRWVCVCVYVCWTFICRKNKRNQNQLEIVVFVCVFECDSLLKRQVNILLYRVFVSFMVLANQLSLSQ